MVDYSETMEVFEIKVTINNESMKIQVYQRNGLLSSVILQHFQTSSPRKSLGQSVLISCRSSFRWEQKFMVLIMADDKCVSLTSSPGLTF